MDCRFGDAINPGIWKVLFTSNSNVVLVNSWTYCSDLFVIFTAWIFGKKVWLRAENPLNQELLKTGWKQKLKFIFLRYVVFKFFIDKFLFIGIENKRFFHFFGVEESDLIYTPYAVDNNNFKTEYKKFKNEKSNLKKKFGIPLNGKVILYSGKYIEKKRPFDLLKALNMLESDDSIVIFMGDGPLRIEMEQYVADYKLKNVFFTGFINQSNISMYYSIADVFVMCSGIGETWGLSINEAMNFELPIIVSSTTGCATDLVTDNGFIFETGNVEQLANCLNKILENNELIQYYGLNSSKLIDQYSIDKIVSNMKNNL
jgi:glycosyltransferase involved in cell wall biosynthesis